MYQGVGKPYNSMFGVWLALYGLVVYGFGLMSPELKSYMSFALISSHVSIILAKRCFCMPCGPFQVTQMLPVDIDRSTGRLPSALHAVVQTMEISDRILNCLPITRRRALSKQFVGQRKKNNVCLGSQLW